MARKKSAVQLQREIDAVLATGKRRLHHATVADEWDVAMDAIMQHDPKRAAKLVRRIRIEHGIVKTPTAFSDALDDIPKDVRQQFLELVEPSQRGTFRCEKCWKINPRPGLLCPTCGHDIMEPGSG